MNNSKPVRNYIKKLKKHLILPQAKKRDFLDGITQELQDFAAAHSECTYQTLESAFGSPETVAFQFIESSNLSGVMHRYKRDRLITLIGVVALLIIIICLGVWIHAMLSDNIVRVTQTITQQPTSTISK